MARRSSRFSRSNSFKRARSSVEGAGALASVALVSPDPVAQRLSGAADLLGDGPDGGPPRRAAVLLVADEADGTLPDLGGAPAGFAHGSKLSSVGASGKPGSIHSRSSGWRLIRSIRRCTSRKLDGTSSCGQRESVSITARSGSINRKASFGHGSGRTRTRPLARLRGPPLRKHGPGTDGCSPGASAPVRRDAGDQSLRAPSLRSPAQRSPSPLRRRHPSVRQPARRGAASFGDRRPRACADSH